MEQRIIIQELVKAIRNNCSRMEDVEGYVENCLLYDVQAGADMYETGKNCFRSCCSIARDIVLTNGFKN